MSNEDMMQHFIASAQKGKKSKPKPEPEPDASPEQEPAAITSGLTEGKWRDIYPVHPAADIFPMLPEEELRKLGEDIKTNGLKEPIVLWSDGNEQHYILDGRNRLTAMELVGMEIRRDHLDHSDFARFVTVDPYAYVISKNIHRRHLTPQERVLLADRVLRAKQIADSDRPERSFRSVKRDTVSGQLQGSEKGHIAQVAEAAKVSKPTARKYLNEIKQPSEASQQPQRRKRKSKEPDLDEPWTEERLYQHIDPPIRAMFSNFPPPQSQFLRNFVAHIDALVNEFEDELGM